MSAGGNGPGSPDSVRQEVRAEAGFAYGAIGADIHVFGDGTPVYLLFARRALSRQDPDWLCAQPSRMLDGRAEVVEFTGREAELADLIDWRDAPARMAVRWLHGPAGQGKTRLAARLAADSERDGWLVVDAVHGTDSHPPAEGSQDLRTAGRVGVLVLVDYADRWPLTHVSWLLSNALLLQDTPVRVLMVGRSVNAWPAVRAKLHRLREAVETSDQRLAGLPEQSAPGRHSERKLMFEAARRCFTAQYHRARIVRSADTLEAIEPPGSLEAPEFGLTLAVHMAALVAVDAQVRGGRAPTDVVGMTTYLLDRERENWRQLHENGDRGLPHATSDTQLARAVFISVLTGPLSGADATRLLDDLPLPVPGAQLVTDHAHCYPPTDAGGHHRLEPLLPDRFAEDFLALSLPGSPVSGHPTDLWTVTAATRSLQRRGDVEPPYTARALSFMIAATERWPHVGERLLFPLLRRDPQLAVDAGSGVLSSLARLETLDTGILEAIEPFLPSGQDVRLDEGIGDIMTRLTTYRMATDDETLVRAMRSWELSDHHIRAGRATEALTAAEDAVALVREAVEGSDEPAGTAAELQLFLAGALVHHANLLARAGRDPDVWTVLSEGIELVRPLPTSDTQRLVLGDALGEMGAAMIRADRAEDGLAQLEEAIRTHAGRMDDAGALRMLEIIEHLWPFEINHSIALSAAGNHEEAVRTAENVLVGVRQMARLKPAALGPVLASAVVALGSALWAGGRHEEALAASRNATDLYRSLAEVEPRYRQQLADSSYRLGTRLGGMDRSLDAVQALQEAVDLYRSLPDTDLSLRLKLLAVASHELREQRRPERIAWGPASAIDGAAKGYAHAGDWPALWRLIRAVPIADAVRTVRRLPRRSAGLSEGDADRTLARRLAVQGRRRTERVVAAAARAAVWRSDYPLGDASQVSFARNRPYMTRTVLEHGGAVERIEVIDLESRAPKTNLYQGTQMHSSVQCLGDHDAIAVRDHRVWGTSGTEIVHYSAGSERLVAAGPPFVGARAAATTNGWILGLRLVPGALVASPGGRPREVDLVPFGLRRGDVLAVDPSGTRLAFADGEVLVVTDADVCDLVSDGRMHEDHGGIRSVAFVSPDELVTSGTGGGLYLSQLESGLGCMVASAEAAPPLDDLFYVPAWRVVGGWASGVGRPYFFDSVTLDPVPVPRPMVGNRNVQAITASPDGRYVYYGGQLDVDAPLRRRSFDWTSALHDLRHPGSLLQRPLSSLTDAELESLDALPLDSATRPLLELARDMLPRTWTRTS
ncbi:tetratricopeptide repeat protein [Nocardiopsis aegyptia]|uniref:Tetratricopeptide (TPR) repeat protein n=1 Tax=Nocardiopsis aegyptia TaxID=220378 RepID=A0A7Z0JE26_9ACTN|nr:tetratricopeptide repeat protein [Nocardiopsis aegyptia]NYJ37984.1 tetratricopeptide (TPR) repeat protein [Nocardiopsis aegyptia]